MKAEDVNGTTFDFIPDSKIVFEFGPAPGGRGSTFEISAEQSDMVVAILKIWEELDYDAKYELARIFREIPVGEVKQPYN